MATERTLAGLSRGERAVLGAPSQLGGTLLRLLELGMTEGASVELLRRGPGGDPLEVRVRGTRLCLRRAEAACFPIVGDGAIAEEGGAP